MEKFRPQNLLVVSGVNKIYLGIGASLAAINIYLILFKKESLDDSLFFIIVSLWLMFLSRPGKVKLYKDKLVIRSFIYRHKSHFLKDLTWVHFANECETFLYFGKTRCDLDSDIPGYKRFRPALEKIAKERLPYFGYMTPSRGSMKRNQLYGCLDCHTIFPPENIKSWTKIEPSLWTRKSIDTYYPKCPNCAGPWVFTDMANGPSATLPAIEKMDGALWKDKDGNRHIPFGLF